MCYSLFFQVVARRSAPSFTAGTAVLRVRAQQERHAGAEVKKRSHSIPRNFIDCPSSALVSCRFCSNWARARRNHWSHNLRRRDFAKRTLSKQQVLPTSLRLAPVVERQDQSFPVGLGRRRRATQMRPLVRYPPLSSVYLSQRPYEVCTASRAAPHVSSPD